MTARTQLAIDMARQGRAYGGLPPPPQGQQV